MVRTHQGSWSFLPVGGNWSRSLIAAVLRNATQPTGEWISVRKAVGWTMVGLFGSSGWDDFNVVLAVAAVPDVQAPVMRSDWAG